MSQSTNSSSHYHTGAHNYHIGRADAYGDAIELVEKLAHQDRLGRRLLDELTERAREASRTAGEHSKEAGK